MKHKHRTPEQTIRYHVVKTAELTREFIKRGEEIQEEYGDDFETSEEFIQLKVEFEDNLQPTYDKIAELVERYPRLVEYAEFVSEQVLDKIEEDLNES